VQDLSLFVFSNLEYHRVQSIPHLSDRPILLGHIRPLIKPVRPVEQFPGFLKSDATLWICPQAPAFADIEAKPHLYNCYTT